MYHASLSDLKNKIRSLLRVYTSFCSWDLSGRVRYSDNSETVIQTSGSSYSSIDVSQAANDPNGFAIRKIKEKALFDCTIIDGPYGNVTVGDDGGLRTDYLGKPPQEDSSAELIVWLTTLQVVDPKGYESIICGRMWGAGTLKFQSMAEQENLSKSEPYFWTGCQLGHGGRGRCEGGSSWVIESFAWRDIYGPYVNLPSGQYNFYVQVEVTGNGDPSYNDPGFGAVPFFVSLAANGGRAFKNYIVTWDDYRSGRDANGLYRGQLTNDPQPVDLPDGIPDLEVCVHFSPTLKTVKVNYLRIIKVG